MNIHKNHIKYWIFMRIIFKLGFLVMRLNKLPFKNWNGYIPFFLLCKQEDWSNWTNHQADLRLHLAHVILSVLRSGGVFCFCSNVSYNVQKENSSSRFLIGKSNLWTLILLLKTLINLMFMCTIILNFKHNYPYSFRKWMH